VVSFWHGFCLLLGEEINLPINTEAMKKSMITLVIALLFAGSGVLMAQATEREYLGLPGDNLNLYAVMNLFQESETLETFEKVLNDPEQMINNLDLNGDGYVDYIMVLDYAEGNIHNIVLRVALNEKDYQDVAVFVVEKLRDGAVLVQLIGDEALYGENYIIEPIYAERPNPGYTGDRGTPARTGVVTTTYYEVAAWPMVNYIYSPTYVVYRPSWRYGYYPVYWQPWRAHYYHYYYGFHHPMHTHYVTYYRPWRRPRTVVYHTTYYTNIRRHSPVVVVNINRGTYRSTYSRPELRSEGRERYEKVYAHRNSVGRSTPASGSRSAAAPARTERQEAISQPAVRPGTAGRAARAGSQEESRSRIEQAGRNTTIQRSSDGSRSNSQPAVRTSNRNERRSNTSAPAVKSTSRTESRNSQPAVRTSNRNESRSSTSAPAVKSTSRTESRNSQPAVRTSNRNESRSNTSAPAVKSTSRTESRNSQPAVRTSNRNESRSNTSAPAVKSTSRTESRNSQPAVRSSSRNESRSKPAVKSSSRTEKRESSSSNTRSSGRRN
jgi:hypothetical protein